MTHRGKLESIFPESMHYYIEKIWESLGDTEMDEFGLLHIEHITEIVDKFKAVLENEGLLDDMPNMQHAFEELAYPMKELHTYFTNSRESRLNLQDASIFTYFISQHITQLEEMAVEIDKEL